MDATAIATIIAAVGATVTAFFAGVLKVYSERNDVQKKDLIKSNEYVNGRVDELRQDIAEMRLEIKHLQSERGELLAKVSHLESSLDKVRAERDKAKKAVSALEKEVKTLRARVDASEEK